MGQNKIIRKKLSSCRGASITFALLLFLVCAVVSSIVVVAGTAAAGRMRNLAEMDQRYYAVTSAVNLLRSEIEGTTVRVEYKKSDNKVSAVSYKKKGDAAFTTVTSATLLSDASRKLTEQILTEGSSSGSGLDTEILRRTFDLKDDVSDAAISLDCVIYESLRRDGLLTFTVMNGSSSEGVQIGKTYQLQVIFTSNVKETAVEGSPDTSCKTITWKLNSLAK